MSTSAGSAAEIPLLIFAEVPRCLRPESRPLLSHPTKPERICPLPRLKPPTRCAPWAARSFPPCRGRRRSMPTSTKKSPIRGSSSPATPGTARTNATGWTCSPPKAPRASAPSSSSSTAAASSWATSTSRARRIWTTSPCGRRATGWWGSTSPIAWRRSSSSPREPKTWRRRCAGPGSMPRSSAATRTASSSWALRRGLCTSPTSSPSLSSSPTARA